MGIQTIFQAGNSHVVAIPKEILNQVGLKPGQKVVVSASPDEETIQIKKAKTKKLVQTKSRAEFNRWLDTFMKENGEILDELAQR